MATATEINNLMRGEQNVPNDPVALMMQEEAATTPRTPEVESAPITPVAPGSFLFRTRPGFGQTAIPLRVYRENPRWDDDKNRKAKNNWEKNAQRVWGATDKSGKITLRWKDALADDAKIADKVGGFEIAFRPVPGRAEATYQTRDPDIAAYIRKRIEEPGLGQTIYEELGETWATLDDGTRVQVLPATESARRVMAASAAGV